MSVYVCPVALVNAPAERVWRLLSDPASYALWWDAETSSILPEGHAKWGQKIYAQPKALGRQWDVHINVGIVDENRRQIDLSTMLPLGITVYNRISCFPVDNGSCRVSFG